MQNLRNKIALVTGGATGIGKGIAHALAAAGCRVAICGRNELTLREAAGEAEQPIEWRICDVSNREDVRTLFEWLGQELGPVDILVNSAGINVANRDMSNVDPAEFDQVMAINFTGTFNCIHAALPIMREQKAGLIVNIVSIAGRKAIMLAGAPYCASKFAQSALGTYVNLEDARNGIRVTNIYPGETNTPIIDRRANPPPEEQRAAMLQPEDIAACVVTIAQLSPRALVPELTIVPPYQPWG